MVSRREFLRIGSMAGLASTLPAGNLLARTADHPLKLTGYVAVCDTRFGEADRFLRGIAADAFTVTAPGADAGSVVTSLAEPLRASRPLLGLTTDATFMVAQQMAREAGYEVRYNGVHRHRAERLRHELEGDGRWIANLAKHLAESEDWATALGELGGALFDDGTRRRRAVAETRSTLAAGSPGHLVSWAMTRAA